MIKVKYTAIIFLFPLFSYALQGQMRTGEWRDHFTYKEGVTILNVNQDIIGVSREGLVFFEGVKKISKVDGLSDFGISTSYYDEDENLIMLGYENGNIDVITAGSPDDIKTGRQTQNIDLLIGKVISGGKRINKFLKVDNKRYVAADFGIFTLDIYKEEILENFTVSHTGASLTVKDIVQFKNMLVTATDSGIYKADKDDPQLYYFGTWERKQPGLGFMSLATTADTLYALTNTGNLLISEDGENYLATSYSNVQMLYGSGEQVWIATATTLINIKTIEQWTLNSKSNPKAVLFEEREGLFMVDALRGLMHYSNNNFETITPNAPYSNKVKVTTEQGGIIAAVGDNFISRLSGEGWTSISDTNMVAPTSVKINPRNTTDAFVATNSGIFRYNNTAQLEHALQGERIGGMDYGRNNRLFAFASSTSSLVKVRTDNDTWVSLPASGIGSSNIQTVTYKNGNFWGIADGLKIFVYSPGSDPESSTDDQSTKFNLVIRNDYLSVTQYINRMGALVADRDNEIWMGNNRGAYIYTSSSNLFSSTPEARRVRVVSDIPGFAAYLLDTEMVTSIAVDGGNRKWFGTSNAGVFLQSSDGSEKIQDFTTSNSPLPSDSIVSISVNSQTGEVVFATKEGVVAYKGDATEGKSDFSTLNIYPNPVRPGMDMVNIAGLMEDAFVRITDMAGNLVFEGVANGGSITWNLQNKKGTRVSTGVYLIFFADGDSGKTTKAGKIMVVN